MRLYLILLTDNARFVTLPRATQTKLTELQNNYHLLNSLLYEKSDNGLVIVLKFIHNNYYTDSDKSKRIEYNYLL